MNVTFQPILAKLDALIRRELGEEKVAFDLFGTREVTCREALRNAP